MSPGLLTSVLSAGGCGFWARSSHESSPSKARMISSRVASKSGAMWTLPLKRPGCCAWVSRWTGSNRTTGVPALAMISSSPATRECLVDQLGQLGLGFVHVHDRHRRSRWLRLGYVVVCLLGLCRRAACILCPPHTGPLPRGEREFVFAPSRICARTRKPPGRAFRTFCWSAAPGP
jgi:hypothetical protein